METEDLLRFEQKYTWPYIETHNFPLFKIKISDIIVLSTL
jgi:hypothetical protein